MGSGREAAGDKTRRDAVRDHAIAAHKARRKLRRPAVGVPHLVVGFDDDRGGVGAELAVHGGSIATLSSIGSISRSSQLTYLSK
jgi:hypothetical protein